MAVLTGLVKFLGVVYVFFVPGLVWSYVLFSRREMEWLERGVIAVALSLGAVVLGIFWLNWLFEVRIDLLNVCLVAGGVTALGAAGLLVKARAGRPKPGVRDSQS